MNKPVSPVPVQSELIPIDESVLLAEFRATFKNEQAYMPEVSLRYLLWLVLSDQPVSEIRSFANQVRLDLNEQRLARAVTDSVSLNVLNVSGNAFASGWKNQKVN